MNLSLLDEINLDSFLKLGYFLKVENSNNCIAQTSTDKLKELSFEELSISGSELFKDIINDNFKPNSKHLVPISGGFDSRLILGNLLEFTPAENIETFTFGIPGTFDFEIGRKLSKKLGVKNHTINLNHVKYSNENLRDASNRFNNQILLFYHPNYLDLIKFQEYQWWSGFLGGTIAGAHFYNKKHENQDEIKLKFLEKNTFVKSTSLTNNPDSAIINLIDDDVQYGNKITYYENIDILNRQLKYIRPQLFPNGFDVFSPFSSKKWTSFFLNIPTDFRIDMLLYKEIMKKNNKPLFQFPCKSQLGLGIDPSKFEKIINYSKIKVIDVLKLGPSIKKRHTNFFDFGSTLKNNKDFQKLNFDLVQNLKSRRLVNRIDIDKIWNDHMYNRSNYGDAIQILSSLEIILQNLDEKK